VITSDSDGFGREEKKQKRTKRSGPSSTLGGSPGLSQIRPIFEDIQIGTNKYFELERLDFIEEDNWNILGVAVVRFTNEQSQNQKGVNMCALFYWPRCRTR